MSGKRLSRAQEDENFQHLSDFRSRWATRPGMTPNVATGIREFRASINYKWDGREKTFISTVRVHAYAGPDDGMIDIDAVRGVSVNKFHLRLQIAWQTYRFDEASESLIVTGSSDKMNGAYRITISPVPA